MGDVIPFKRKTAKEKHGKKIMCKSGFHKWQVDVEKKFDVKEGKLVTVYKCHRCGAIKNEAR